MAGSWFCCGALIGAALVPKLWLAGVVRISFWAFWFFGCINKERQTKTMGIVLRCALGLGDMAFKHAHARRNNATLPPHVGFPAFVGLISHLDTLKALKIPLCRTLGAMSYAMYRFTYRPAGFVDTHACQWLHGALVASVPFLPI